MSSSPSSPTVAVPPKGVVQRLSLYLRELRKAVSEGRNRISSTQLGELLDLKSAQVRKDLSYLGQVGKAGLGYSCSDLIAKIQRTLGTDKTWPVVLIGSGKIGQALLSYGGFERQGFQLVAAFDIHPSIIGTRHGGIRVQPIQEAADLIRNQGIRLAILAVPAEEAQLIAEQLVAAGIQGILNFAPVILVLPKSVCVVAVDLAVGLEQLAFGVARQRENS